VLASDLEPHKLLRPPGLVHVCPAVINAVRIPIPEKRLGDVDHGVGRSHGSADLDEKLERSVPFGRLQASVKPVPALEVVPHAELTEVVADPARPGKRVFPMFRRYEHAAASAVTVLGEVVLAYSQPSGRVRCHRLEHMDRPELVWEVTIRTWPEVYEPSPRRALDVAGNHWDAHRTKGTTGQGHDQRGFRWASRRSCLVRF
jgi:hypothetical protein